jgi:EmrB/QacA subfamily drug resistance transporter
MDRKVWSVAIVVILGAVMSILDTTIVNVALETLQRDLHAPLSTIQWVSTGYLLALATVIPLTGWAATRFGARRVWMVAVAGFTVASGLAGLAWSAESLIAIRVLQGLAGGMIMPVGMMTLAQTAGPKHMGRVMSVVGVPMLLAPVLGPVLGGLILTSVSWRWIFWVNLPVGAIGLVLAHRLLPVHVRGQDSRPLDVPGFLLVSPGVALVVFGLSEIAAHGGTSPLAVGSLVGGLVLMAAFVRRGLRHDSPLVDLRLFAKRGFAAAAGTVFLVGGALFGTLLLLPLYYQVARGLSPLDAGLLIAPQGVGAAAGMSIGGRMTDRVGGGKVVLVGLCLLIAGTFAFTQVGARTPYWILAAALVVRGFGLGGTMMPAMAAAYATLEREEVPRATPMLNTLQRVGGSLGTAILAVVLQHNITAELGSNVGRGGAGRTLPANVRERVATPLAHAFASSYWWALGVTALALVPAGFLAVVESREGRADKALRETAPHPATA